MYIIIGQGAAGTAAANLLRRIDPAAPVTVITEEPDYFYSRIDLPDVIAGKYSPEYARLQGAEQFAEIGITCRMGERVAAVIPDRHVVQLADGTELEYKKLLLATGSHSVVPPLPGCSADGVHVLWTLAQAQSLVAASQTAKAAVVIGSGLIGVKTALALAVRGLSVTLIEKLPRVLPRQLDETASGIVADRIRGKGITVLTGTAVEEIKTTATGAVAGVQLADRVIACDLVVMAVGVKANTELAAAAGISVRRGIVADEYMQTSSPDIYTAGDAAEVCDALTGEHTVPAIWPEAVEQGQTAAQNMAGRKVLYTPGAAMNSVEIAGVPLVSIGDIQEVAGDEVFTNQRNHCYKKVVMRQGVVRGILCVGDIRQAGVLGGLVLRQVQCDDVRRMLSGSFGFSDLLAI